MTNAFNFDPSKLSSLLDQHGSAGTWALILYTHVLEQPEEFHYILKDPYFDHATRLSENLISHLTIGEIGVLYEYSVSYVDRKDRKKNGQFFTPDDVAQFMVREVSDFPAGKWLDPCSGIGNLAWHLVDSASDKEDFLTNSLVLSDRDELALKIARVLLTISFQSKNKALYESIEENFVVLDFLSVADDGGLQLFPKSNLEKIPEHDYVIVNPPYRAISKEDSRFETAKAKDLYAYFLENIVKSSKGFVAITPQSFTNAAKFSVLRSLLIRTFPDLRIYTFDNIPGNIFFGVKFGSENSNKANSIRAAVTVARLGNGRHRITSLLRWKTNERVEVFKNAAKFLADIRFTEDFFPKVSAQYLDLYEDLIKRKTLGHLLAATPTPFVLYVPAAPRYFISALKKSVSRSSMKTLFFTSEEELNKAYLLLNSSLMYWWWRVRDGGMTLALETIKSLPMPDFELSRDLVEELEASETANKVYKRNAGSLQENVKHPLSLVKKLNKLIVPRYWQQISGLHENSDFSQMRLSKASETVQ